MRALALPLLVLLTACGLTACGLTDKDRRISYATVQTLNPGVDGRWILEEFPHASGVTRRPDGTLQTIQYRVSDPQGRGQTLTLHFDEFGVLARKAYSGPLVKPLGPDPESQRGVTGKPRDR
jgi:hypothetical protein